MSQSTVQRAFSQPDFLEGAASYSNSLGKFASELKEFLLSLIGRAPAGVRADLRKQEVVNVLADILAYNASTLPIIPEIISTSDDGRYSIAISEAGISIGSAESPAYRIFEFETGSLDNLNDLKVRIIGSCHAYQCNGSDTKAVEMQLKLYAARCVFVGARMQLNSPTGVDECNEYRLFTDLEENLTSDAWQQHVDDLKISLTKEATVKPPTGEETALCLRWLDAVKRCRSNPDQPRALLDDLRACGKTLETMSPQCAHLVTRADDEIKLILQVEDIFSSADRESRNREVADRLPRRVDVATLVRAPDIANRLSPREWSRHVDSLNMHGAHGIGKPASGQETALCLRWLDAVKRYRSSPDQPQALLDGLLDRERKLGTMSTQCARLVACAKIDVLRKLVRTGTASLDGGAAGRLLQHVDAGTFVHALGLVHESLPELSEAIRVNVEKLQAMTDQDKFFAVTIIAAYDTGPPAFDELFRFREKIIRDHGFVTKVENLYRPDVRRKVDLNENIVKESVRLANLDLDAIRYLAHSGSKDEFPWISLFPDIAWKKDGDSVKFWYISPIVRYLWRSHYEPHTATGLLDADPDLMLRSRNAGFSKCLETCVEYQEKKESTDKILRVIFFAHQESLSIVVNRGSARNLPINANNS
ncbi:hypothetical protein [Paraburkholderia sediminicola]|uniref:hypothetical protein n=1 Tax=Paraburkholderia sediminicola TaxID=458836 RepID=UPI0038BAB039